MAPAELADRAAWLEDRARLYLIFTHDADGSPRIACQRAALTELLESPDPLAVLERLDDATRLTLAKAADADSREFPSDPPRGVVKSLGYIRLRKAERHPGAVCDWARDALARLPSDRGGRPRRDALRWFVEALAHFYYRETGKPPKRSYDPKNKRDCGRFHELVLAALLPIDPEAVRMSNMGHIIREVIEGFTPASE
ncbi:MAG: hypothetical protein V3R83_11720 [Gammaproteobacteria bacterium]